VNIITDHLMTGTWPCVVNNLATAWRIWGRSRKSWLVYWLMLEPY